MSKNSSGEGRFRKRLLNDIPVFIDDICKELNSAFEHFNGVPDDKIGNIITYNLSGSYINQHQDDYGSTQLRLNIITNKDDFSGNPIINGLMYQISAGDGWVFSPSHNSHGTSKIKNGIRINLSLGWNFSIEKNFHEAFNFISSK